MAEINTRRPVRWARRAKATEMADLPTPPLPETIISLRSSITLSVVGTCVTAADKGAPIVRQTTSVQRAKLKGPMWRN